MEILKQKNFFLKMEFDVNIFCNDEDEIANKPFGCTGKDLAVISIPELAGVRTTTIKRTNNSRHA